MKLIVTIDTEEDNWGQYNLVDYSLENIAKISSLQVLFDRYLVKPTYLITYPVASNDDTVSLLKKIMEKGRCEIGTHCHPWNTPPFEETRTERNSMLCNLTADLQYKKIDSLHQMIIRNFGVVPTSFRAGRWGFGKETAQCLSQLGYEVDSSVVAFMNWKDYGGPDFSDILPKPFMWKQTDGSLSGLSCPTSQLLEIPATVGFAQKDFLLCNQIWKFLGRKFLRRLRLRGVLDEINLLNKIMLSPETSCTAHMIKLTTVMINQGYQVINMFFHSNSLKAGLSPFVKTKEDEILFLRRIEDFLAFAQRAGIESVKISDVSAYTNYNSWLVC